MRSWQDEKEELLATIRRKDKEATVLARRFKLLQKTLKEQQKLLDRYQRALGVGGVTNDKARSNRTDIITTSKRNQDVLLPVTTDSVNMSRPETKAWVTRKDPAFPSVVDKPPSPTIQVGKAVLTTAEEQEKSQILKNSSKTHRGLAATWAEEKQRMHKKPKWEKTMDQHNEVRARSGSGQQKKQEKKGFAYVEVVRNREERAALPAHDCVECKRYYDALGGLGSPETAAAQMNKCSRHRARFEPYQTPDDFWRLSFPDSEHESRAL